MADRLMTIDVDRQELLASLERLGSVAQPYVSDASEITAGEVQREARVRVRRRTGTMAAAITVEQDGDTFLVFVEPHADPGGGMRPANLPLWHEKGTRTMTAQPFMFNSARLEEAPHLRRVSEAVQDAIDALGLGD